MICRGYDLLWPEDRHATFAQSVEGLWRSDFMNEMPVDVQDGGASFDRFHDVAFPDLIE
jgi:hypothetical protein